MSESNPPVESELTELLLSKPKLSKISVKTYISMYNKLAGLISPSSVRIIGEKQLIKKVQSIDNPNTQAGLLNISFLIKQLYGVDSGLIKSAIDEQRSKIKTHSQQVNVSKGKTLPSVQEYAEYVESLRSSGQYKKYVINYMLLNYGVRNIDVDVFITTSKTIANGVDNYLLVMTNQIKYIRNKYKTVGSYGKKTIVIKDRVFQKVVKTLLETWLLTNSKTERIGASSIGNAVLKSTMNDMGEGSIFKMLVDDSRTHANVFERLTELGEYRGTDLSTIIARYDVNKQPIKISSPETSR